MNFGFTHTYSALPANFYARVRPTPAAHPQLVIFNRALAAELGLDAGTVERHAATIFSGNDLPEDANPIALAYAGHQFGHFVPQLGDGRAILLGELDTNDGLRDVQLKGSGRTPFSRQGDGLAALGPMLREYLVSEAMHALGTRTTRSLAVVTTGQKVLREGGPLPGAVLTRVAASHIRVGTFQYFAVRGDREAMKALLDYTIARHYPETKETKVPALALLDAVANRQASLLADWMRVGFIHGVMNTDNMAVSGETIDYGPCAFMDEYDSGTVFSSIDRHGRYAFANQPAIAQWNLARFAETLLPLIDGNADEAIGQATAAVEGFIERFDGYFLERMRNKLGFGTTRENDPELIQRLLALMHTAAADFTLTFRSLAEAAEDPARETGLRERFAGAAEIDRWIVDWRARLTDDPQGAGERATRMRLANPAFIPRNHQVEAALNAASVLGDFEPFHRLLGVLQRPYEDQPDAAEFMQPPKPHERVLATFCGT
jgi:uncharacterized protein YdiU (UPF0061 family)